VVAASILGVISYAVIRYASLKPKGEYLATIPQSEDLLSDRQVKKALEKTENIFEKYIETYNLDWVNWKNLKPLKSAKIRGLASFLYGLRTEFILEAVYMIIEVGFALHLPLKFPGIIRILGLWTFTQAHDRYVKHLESVRKPEVRKEILDKANKELEKAETLDKKRYLMRKFFRKV
jgi:hypothetical protein